MSGIIRHTKMTRYQKGCVCMFCENTAPFSTQYFSIHGSASSVGLGTSLPWIWIDSDNLFLLWSLTTMTSLGS